MALEELGPAFVKVGQLLSTRADLLPASLTRELSHLQDEVAPFPSAKAREIIETGLKAPLEQIFKSFDAEPLAAASIGQVHRAVLQSGETVAVKVKRPGIDLLIKNDLDILVELAALVERRAGPGAFNQFSDIARRLEKLSCEAGLPG